MIRIYIFADSHKHFSDAMKEYEKRLGRGVEVVLLRPSKSKDPARVIAEDTQMMIQKLEKQSGYTFVLNPLGKEYSTEQFQERIESLKQHHGNFIFAIGGAYGFDYTKLTPYISEQISLSLFTMPHSLALLVLLEQLYRIDQITQGSKYHK